MPDLIKFGETPRQVQGYAPPQHLPHWTPPPPLDLQHYFFVLLRRKWLILAVLLAVVLPTAAYNFLARSLYRSTARIQIDPESTKVLPYKEVADTDTAYSAFDEYFKTQVEILKGPKLAEKLAEEVTKASGAIPDPSPYRDRFGWLEAWKRKSSSRRAVAGAKEKQSEYGLTDLSVTQVRGSRLIDISYTAPSPEFAALVANKAAAAFIDLHFANKYQTTQDARKFLEKQLADFKAGVEKAEQALIEYAIRNGIMNLSDKENDVIRQRLEQLNSQRTQIEAQYNARSARLSALREATWASLPTEFKNKAITEAEDRLLQLEQEIANLQATYGDNWPPLNQKKKEIAEVRNQLNRERENTYSQAMRRAELEYQTARSEFEMVSRKMKEQIDLTGRLNEASVQYNQLKREVDTNQQLYQALLQRLKETGLASGLEFGNIHIVETARPATAAASPRVLVNLTLALMLGLMLGIGLAFFLDYLDDTIKTAESVEQLTNLPALATMPLSESLKGIAPAKERKQLPVTLSLKTEPQKAAPLFAGADRGLVEACLRLRTSILLSSPDKPPQTILVTSAIPGEGKTTITSQLGIALAQTGAHTILIDLDLRKSDLSAWFGLNGKHSGMSVFLSGNSSLLSDLVTTEIPNLLIAPAGPRPPSPADLLSSERMRKTLEMLKSEFRFIVIDSPPIMSVTDAAILAPLVDGVVMVVRSGLTPKKIVNQASVLLRRAGSRLLGVVLNAADYHNPEYQYYGRYYNQDHYYTSAADVEQIKKAEEFHPSGAEPGIKEEKGG